MKIATGARACISHTPVLVSRFYPARRELLSMFQISDDGEGMDQIRNQSMPYDRLTVSERAREHDSECLGGALASWSLPGR